MRREKFPAQAPTQPRRRPGAKGGGGRRSAAPAPVKKALFAALVSALLLLSCLGAARADVFYAVSNYENGSAGVITKDGGVFAVSPGAVSNLGVDAWGLTFRDADGEERAMIREYQYGPNDTVYVWDPADFRRPVFNAKTWGSNVHAAAANGRHLYVTTYESYKDGSGSQDTGEVVRIDMENGYRPDRRYRYEAFTGDAGFASSPHGEAIHIENGRIYVLFGVSYKGVNEYEPTEVVEFDADLNRLRTVRLKDSAGNVGKNAMRMAAHGGKLYVANMGGYQGPDSWGDLWEVDTGTMTARRVLDGHGIPYTVDGQSVNVGLYGVQFAADGTAFLLAGSYGADYAFRARLFITTAEALSGGDAGSAVAEFSGTRNRGYSWDILWDEEDSALWLMAGTRLEARDKSGRLFREFTPAELGDNIYSIALLDGGGSSDPSVRPDTPAVPATPGLPGDAPPGVTPSAPAPVEDKTRLSDAGLPDNWLTTAGGGWAVSGAAAAEQAGRLWENVRGTEPLPAFTAETRTPGGTAAVGFEIRGDRLPAGNAEDIRLMKVRADGPVGFSHDAAGYGDGTFRLLRGGSPHGGAITPGETYTLVMFIEDGGGYDLDGKADGSVLDPAVIVGVGEPDGGGPAGSGDGSGGGGGCASGASGAALISFILAVAYMTSKRKKALLTILLTALLALPFTGAAEAALVKLLVTPGAGVRAFSKEGGEYLRTAHFVPFREYSLTKGPDEGGYETYTCAVEGERFHYVAGGGGSGFLKTAEVVYVRADETEKTATVDVGRLDPSKREDNGFKGDGVYFNVNDARSLVLNAGESFRLIPVRVWQAEEGFTENYFIEPDYEVEILGDAGAVSSAWAGSPGLEYAEITALRPGVAIIKVTYGPLRFEYGGGRGEHYNAIDPVNTGIVVVTVLEAGKGKASGMTTGISAREYDTAYFDRAEADHAEYTFRPSAGGETSVRAHSPLHGGTAWGAGWSGAVKNADGSFTVRLREGRNVVEVSSTGAAFSEHHVINAGGIDIDVTNLTNQGWKKGDALNPGDRLEISFDGIRTPLEKIAGIYNPGFPDTCYVKYDSQGGAVRGDGVQYDLSEDNALTVTVPASGTVRLRGGVINCDHMGDPLGSHRTRIGNEPVYPNFTAVNVKGEYSSMPDITLGSAVASAEVTGDGGARPATEVDVRGLLPDGSVSVGPDGTVTVSGRAFREGLGGADRAAVDAGTLTPLPVSVSGVAAGGTALVTLRLRPGGFTGEAFGTVAVLKMKPGGAVARLDMAASRETLADGLFVWADAAGRVVPPSEKIAAGAEYFLCVAVEDGGGYDLDGERQGTVVDPLALALADAEAGDGGSGGGGNGGAAGTGGGGGGCDTGALAAAGLAAMLAALMKTRKAEGGF